jgi:hypothetical protein
MTGSDRIPPAPLFTKGGSEAGLGRIHEGRLLKPEIVDDSSQEDAVG